MDNKKRSLDNIVVAIKLREAMEAYRRRTGIRMTYEKLSEGTGLTAGALRIMGSKLGYNATLRSIAAICVALETTPGELLELVKDPAARQTKRIRKATKLRTKTKMIRKKA